MEGREYLDLARKLPVRPLREMIGGGGIVVVAPHPDDESLGCGGLIAEASALGMAVRLIFISDGAGSHPNSVSFPKARLRVEREMEARKAGAVLGVAPAAMTFLGLPDRAVKAEGAEAEGAIGKILDMAREIQASAIFVTSNLDPHCDHQAAFEIVRRAYEELPGTHIYAYPIWAWQSSRLPAVSGHPRGFKLDIKRHLLRKRAAIEQHRTQLGDVIQDDPQGFHLDRDMIDFFLAPYEIYLEPTQ